jgi:hypothetical protein
MVPRTGLDDTKKRKFLSLPGLELRPLRRAARSQSLYRLSYPGSQLPFRRTYRSVRFEVLTTVIMKSIIFCDVRPCSPVKVNRRFGWIYLLHLQG